MMGLRRGTQPLAAPLDEATIVKMIDERIAIVVDERIAALFDEQIATAIDARLPGWALRSREFPTSHEGLGRRFALEHGHVYAYGEHEEGAGIRWHRIGHWNLPEASVLAQLWGTFKELRTVLLATASDDCLPSEGVARIAWLNANTRTSHAFHLVLGAAAKLMPLTTLADTAS